MLTETEKETIIQIALRFIYNALSGFKENNTDYYISVYTGTVCLDVYLHNIKTLRCYRVWFSNHGTIEVTEIP